MLWLVGESPRPASELDGEAVEALIRDGLLTHSRDLVRLPGD